MMGGQELLWKAGPGAGRLISAIECPKRPAKARYPEEPALECVARAGSFRDSTPFPGGGCKLAICQESSRPR